MTETPQICLITPPVLSIDSFTPRLIATLDAAPVACLRLSMASRDEDEISRAADALREISHARDIALVIETHVQLVERLGLDGVHLPRGGQNIRKLRTQLGADAIIGAACGVSRHDGLNAAEAGADYIAFGPVGATTLGDGARAEAELFEWWSEMIEIPCIAEGALTGDLVEALTPVTDFFAFGDEIWSQDDPAAALRALVARMG